VSAEEPSRRAERSIPVEVSDRAIQWVVRLNSGEATRADRRALEAWRAAAREHEWAFQEAQATWHAASGLVEDPRTGLVRAAATPAASQIHRRPIWLQLGAAIAVLLLLVAGLAVWSSGFWWAFDADQATGTGQVRTVRLDDGSIVALNARSAIDVVYSGSSRRIVLLAGEAYFQVAHDSLGRPFEVDAGHVVVTDLGTRFDVAREPGERVSVAVLEHEVRLSWNGPVLINQSNAASGIVLQAGQGVIINSDGSFQPVVRVSAPAVEAWRSGRLIAEGRSLSEVTDALAAYHHGWIIVTPEAARLPVSAVLDLKDFDGSLASLAATLPIRIHRPAPLLVIVTTATR
jgi:transmembrane sensor